MGCSWFGRVSVHGTSGNQCKAHPGLPTWYWHSRFQKRRADQTKRDQAHLSVGRSPYSRGSGQKTTTGFFGKKSIKNLNVKPLSFWEDICTPRWVVKKYLRSVWSPHFSSVVEYGETPLILRGYPCPAVCRYNKNILNVVWSPPNLYYLLT